MKTKSLFAWLIFITIAVLLGGMAICNAVSALPFPRLDVQPYIGVALHISPENPSIRVVDSFGGTDLVAWRKFRLGVGGTSYGYGVVVSRQIWVIPFLDAGFWGGHVWSSKPHWCVAGVIKCRW